MKKTYIINNCTCKLLMELGFPSTAIKCRCKNYEKNKTKNNEVRNYLKGVGKTKRTT